MKTLIIILVSTIQSFAQLPIDWNKPAIQRDYTNKPVIINYKFTEELWPADDYWHPIGSPNKYTNAYIFLSVEVTNVIGDGWLLLDNKKSLPFPDQSTRYSFTNWYIPLFAVTNLTNASPITVYKLESYIRFYHWTSQQDYKPIMFFQVAFVPRNWNEAPYKGTPP